VVMQATAESFLDLAAGRLRIGDALRGGSVSLSGDREALRSLRSMFRWPERQQRPEAAA
jgi:hypothetical protein